MQHPYLFWIGFHLLIFILLFIDMGIFQKKVHAIRVKEALVLSGFWIAVALLFNGLIYYFRGPEAALQFFAGYLVEKSLSVDNLFVFLMIFTYFKVPPMYQHKVLYWGILGALVLRIVLILAGVGLIQKFHWIIYLLGAFLVFSGAKFALQKEQNLLPEQNWLVRLCKRFIPLSERKSLGQFFVVERGKWKMTYLFLVLVMIESTDVVFALDSIPAIFAITTDPFIVYTSNIFAILGLRSLYFALAHSLDKLKYFKFGLSAILVFIGAKMILAEIYPIQLMTALLVIIAILAATTVISLASDKKRKR
ncbi:MAG: TerC family protein [Verrucomicrobia bacterium]|nr:TerC family protein [Verrucomicrobiota bacterium]